MTMNVRLYTPQISRIVLLIFKRISFYVSPHRRGGLVKKKNRDHPNYDIVEIGQNTQESSGDLRFTRLG